MEDDLWKYSTKKKNFKESKPFYNDTLKEIGNDLYLSSIWTVWIHENNNTKWDKLSFVKLYCIDSIGSFWRFFNNFHLIDKNKYGVFIMRDSIQPIWEDNKNRKGGICSIKFNCVSNQQVNNEAMVALCLLVVNETFISDDDINGVTYAIKGGSVLIKIWYKTFSSKFIDKIPVEFITRLEKLLDKKPSIQIKPIKPETD